MKIVTHFVQSLSHVWLFATPWPAVHQASQSFTVSQSLHKFMSTESVMLSNHLILCHPLLLLSSIFSHIRIFSNESALHIRWPKIRPSARASVFPKNFQGTYTALKGISIWELSQCSPELSMFTPQLGMGSMPGSQTQSQQEDALSQKELTRMGVQYSLKSKASAPIHWVLQLN